MARILVVDDSPTIRRVVTNILEMGGFDTIEAVDGQDALDVLHGGEAKVDLVLLDFVMPRMNGFQFARAIRQEEPLSALPIILMSAKSDRIRQQFVEQTGSVDAIAKPFDADALIAVVENALQRRNDRPTAPRLPDSADSEESEAIQLDSVQLQVMQLVPTDAPESLPPDVLMPDSDDGERTVARATAPVALLAVHLRDILAPIVPEITLPDVAKKLTDALTNDVVRDLSRVTSQLMQVEPVLLSGDLGVLPAGAILQLLQSESQTGKLVATSGKGEITVTFRGGLIDLVQSKGAGDEFRLGRYFVQAGLVTHDEIEALARGETLPAIEASTSTSTSTPTATSTATSNEAARAEEKSEASTEAKATEKEAEPSPETTKSNGITHTAESAGPTSSVLVKVAERIVDDVVTAHEVKAPADTPSDADTAVGDRKELPLATNNLVDDDDDDDENRTRIAASAFKREVEMPKDDSSSQVVGDDEVEDAPDSQVSLEAAAKAGDKDGGDKDGKKEEEDDKDDAEVLSSRELLQYESSSAMQAAKKTPSAPPVSAARLSAAAPAAEASIEGPISMKESKPFPMERESKPADVPPFPTSAPELADVKVAPKGPRPLLGDALVQAGRITEVQLREALVRQSSELVYELLRWQKGHFDLVRAPPPPLAERTKLGLPVAQVVVEGFRRVDEWRALESSVGDFESVLIRDHVVASTLKEDAFTRAEKRVLDAIDGEHTVREVIAATHLSSFDVCRILAQFLEARIVRRRTNEGEA